MPVYMKINITKGWKNEANDRFGPAVVVQFKDQKTGKELFQYAPNHTDKEFWDTFFKFLNDYDNAVKNLRDLNNKGVESSGCEQSNSC